MKIIDPEEILISIQKENWKPVLDFLHLRKEEIKNNSLLEYSSRIFESEFFKKLKEKNNKIEYDYLRNLFLLHNGKFFILNENNYETLVVELAKQSSGKTAYDFATLFPNNEFCKSIIKKGAKYQNNKIPKETNKKMNWIEIYNRVFEIINNQGDTSTYFSGPRFINTLKEFDTYHPDYIQYINLRNEQGKSTSRKIFYYDILMELNESLRIDFINRILQIVEPFDKARVRPIKELISGKSTGTTKITGKLEKKETLDDNVTTVFISYSWDNETHKNGF